LDFAFSRGIDPTKISTVACHDLTSDHSMVKVLYSNSYLRGVGEAGLTVGALETLLVAI